MMRKKLCCEGANVQLPRRKRRERSDHVSRNATVWSSIMDLSRSYHAEMTHTPDLRR